MSIKAEYLAVDALASWLRLKLPAKVAEVNATRAAVLRSPAAGSFTVPVGAVLKLSMSGKDGPFTSCALTSGTRTSTQVATNINTGMGATVATVDTADRVVLTSTTAPTAGTPSFLALGPDTTGANGALGWDAGGEYVINTALVAPGHREVMDGWPQQLDSGRKFMVVIGKRTAVPIDPELRRDEHVVTLELSLFRAASQQENHRSREHVHACMQCVREVLTTDTGRMLGAPPTGASPAGIVLVQLGRGAVEAMRFQPLKSGKPFGPLLDSASLILYVKVFERPASS